VQVANYLRSNHIEVYHPTLRVKPVNPRAAKVRPYFPRYLFVHADLDAVGVGALQWVPGAVGLVSFDGEPAIVPDHFVHELRGRLADIEAVGGLELDGLEQGDPVEITHGPFTGQEAIFDMRLSGEERVQVLLHWLGREMKVKLNAHAVAKRRRR
jgi:transcriptional antiterminator RfaH